jgi:ATP-binding cassette subfamily B protein
MIARLNEASVIEQTDVTELFSVIAPLGQLLAAAVLLALGVLPLFQLPLFCVFVCAAIWLGVAYHRRYRACYRERLALTEDLVEKIVGHRTRAVQANQAELHEAEDAALHDYARASARLDHVATLMDVFGRIWLLAAGGTLLCAFALGATGAELLPSAVGVFLVYTSLPTLLSAARSYAAWSCAWRGVRPLFEAGLARADSAPKSDTGDAGHSTIVSAVSFAYRSREVLRGVNLRIESGERILIGGPSGGGKTTFSKLLTGELRANTGTILVGGVDSASVSGAAWRRRVAASPQFHENYVFANSFGFNVDPTGKEGELSPEAREVCFELGLKSLLGKMPSRAAQLLGETGWQLSHGERSRVFIARSLLQGAEVLVFDESFSALDPESLQLAMQCVRKRAPTLLVIAHQ